MHDAETSRSTNRTPHADLSEMVIEFRQQATALREKRDRAFSDIRRTLTRLGHAPGGDSERQLLNDPEYAKWLAEAESLEARADAIENLLTLCRMALGWYDENLDLTPVDWDAGRDWTDPMTEALGGR